MQYDPIKKSLGKVFNQTPVLRIFFYRLLDLLLLRSWHIRKALKKWAAKQTNEVAVLDAGSGFGQYVWFISSLNKHWKVTGADVKQEQIDDCNNFFSRVGREERVTFKYTDLTKLAEKNQYNLILSVDVMEHIEEDELVFKNFFNALKTGGTILISTPSDQGGSDSHEHHHDEMSGFIDEHVRDGYNTQDISEKLTRAGFKDIEAFYTYGTPGKISWKLSMKYPIVMLNASKILFIILPLYYLLTYPVAFVLNYFDTIGKHKTGTGLMVRARK